MKSDVEAIASTLLDRVSGRAAWRDVLEDEPDLTDEEAYRIQFAFTKVRTAPGDSVAGYKAAYTSLAVQAQRGNGGPIMGAFLASATLPETGTVPFVAGSRNAAEAEVAILLGADLPGPRVTPLDVRRASALLLPAIEIAVGAPGDVKRSRQMVIATHKSAGSVVVGGPGVAPAGIDLRTEGAVLSIDGEVRASATAVEVMGDPFVAAAFIANTVLANGDRLRAGMLLMTGSITAAIPLSAGDVVRADFTRLGSVGVRLSR